MFNLIKYKMHLLLNSPYKFIINLFILFAIYIISYNTKILYCMTENQENADIEIMPALQQVQAPRNDHSLIYQAIEEFLGPMQTIHEQADIIQRQTNHIEKLNNQIWDFHREIHDHKRELTLPEETIRQLKDELNVTRDELNYTSVREFSYREQYQELKKQNDLQNQRERDLDDLMHASIKLNDTITQELYHLQNQEKRLEDIRIDIKNREKYLQLSFKHQKKHIAESSRYLFDAVAFNYEEYESVRQNLDIPTSLHFEHETNKRLIKIIKNLEEDHFSNQFKEQVTKPKRRNSF